MVYYDIMLKIKAKQLCIRLSERGDEIEYGVL